MAQGIATKVQPYLLQLHAMPVFVLAPVSGAAQAFGLQAVFKWVLGELAPGSAVAAAGVGFHWRPAIAVAMRASAIEKYLSSRSMPMKDRPVFTAATPVVPLPMVLSRTVSPSFV